MTDSAALYRSPEAYQAVMAAYDDSLAHIPWEHESRLVATRLGSTHVIVAGNPDGPPVVLFHGWNGNAAGLGASFSFLLPNYRLFMPDIIGHAGKSAATRPPTGGATFADWVTELLDGLGLDRVRMAGISGGGWLTMKFAAYYPDRLHKAVIINADGLVLLDPRFAFWALPAVLWPTRRTARWFLRGLAPGSDNEGQMYRRFLLAMVPVLRHFRYQRNPGRLPGRELQRIRTPLLAFMGEKDIFWPRQAAGRARQQIPGLVAVRILPGAGHVLLDRQIGLLAAPMKGFLDDRDFVGVKGEE